MSNCISREGEYSDHKPDKDFCCTRCFALDETGLLARVRELEAERDAALAAIERVRVAKHEVDSVHQIHGADCLCGYSSARSRSRTEHITEAMLAALDGAPEPDRAAQFERAAIVLYERGWHGTRTWDRDATEAGKIGYRNRARAALVAAAGAASQAEGEYVYCPIHGDLLAAQRSFVCEHAKKGHEYAAPVLPSSGVDEDKLAALDGAPEPGREAQFERVAARLREIVYLCGDDLGCQCEEAQDASADLARELSIIAAERPTLTADEVWAIAKAEHDYACDRDNVGAFVDSLTDALRTAGVAFDEQPFIDSGYLLPVEGEKP